MNKEKQWGEKSQWLFYEKFDSWIIVFVVNIIWQLNEKVIEKWTIR